jgi:hypothetical protein
VPQGAPFSHLSAAHGGGRDGKMNLVPNIIGRCLSAMRDEALIRRACANVGFG